MHACVRARVTYLSDLFLGPSVEERTVMELLYSRGRFNKVE